MKVIHPELSIFTTRRLATRIAHLNPSLFPVSAVHFHGHSARHRTKDPGRVSSLGDDSFKTNFGVSPTGTCTCRYQSYFYVYIVLTLDMRPGYRRPHYAMLTIQSNPPCSVRTSRCTTLALGATSESLVTETKLERIVSPEEACFSVLS